MKDPKKDLIFSQFVLRFDVVLLLVPMPISPKQSFHFQER